MYYGPGPLLDHRRVLAPGARCPPGLPRSGFQPVAALCGL